MLIAATAHAGAAAQLPDFTGLVEQARASVVNVSTTGNGTEGLVPPDGVPFDDFLRKFFDNRPRDEIPHFDQESQGSGFIVSADGYVVTNHHVVRGAQRVVVRLSDRREFDADLVGSDQDSDIALLKIDAEDLPVVRIGDSANLRVGEWVLAIGSPFGFEHSVTAGIVSAIGRTLPDENYVPFIQTDVAINPGNSGGPLFNLEGEVVGVNSQIFSRTGGYMGLSFAVPINMAMDVVQQLKTRGRVTRGWLGVYIQDVTRELAESFGMDKPHGALVARVLEASPAAEAGLEPGDVIVRYAGQSIERSSGLPPRVGRTPPGKTVEIVVIREGERQTLAVTIGELAERQARAESMRNSGADEHFNERLGIAVTIPTSEQRESLDLGEKGVVVDRIEPGPAKQAGVHEGDGIVMIGGEPVTNIEAFNTIVDRLPAQQVIPMLVHRDRGPLFLPLKLPAR